MELLYCSKCARVLFNVRKPSLFPKSTFLEPQKWLLKKSKKIGKGIL